MLFMGIFTTNLSLFRAREFPSADVGKYKPVIILFLELVAFGQMEGNLSLCTQWHYQAVFACFYFVDVPVMDVFRPDGLHIILSKCVDRLTGAVLYLHLNEKRTVGFRSLVTIEG